MAKKKVQSIERNIADLANGWLKSYKLDYKLEQESLNTEIDKALYDYFSKNGGTGANRPDAKLLLQDGKLNYYPVLIEYKGYKDKLVKLDSSNQVENKTTKNEPNFKHINSYAVNGAVHYANALLHHTSYTDIIAIGMTGYRDELGKIQHQIGVYYVSKKNLGAGQKVGDFTDFSFLAPNNFDVFIEQVETLSLTQEELDKLKEKREQEITASLTKLNNDIYQHEKGLGENDRAYFQSNEFTVLSDAYAIRWKDKSMHISQNQYLFMVMCINKFTDLPIYSYKNKLGGWNVVKEKNILLPIKDNKIDFDFMETFINAIKNLH